MAKGTWSVNGLVRKELLRLAPALLLKILFTVALSEWAVMALLPWLGVRAGVWTTLTDVLLLTLFISYPLYLLVFRPVAELAAQSGVAHGLARFQALVEAARDPIFIIGRERTLEYVNSFAAQQLGRPPEEVVGKRPQEFFPCEFADKQERRLESVFTTGEPVHDEMELTLADGKVWQSTRLVPLKDAAGSITGVLGISRDITARKRAEEECQRSAERFRELLEAIPVAMRVIQNGVIAFSNPAHARLLGYDRPEEMVGTDALQYIAEADRERLRDYLVRRSAGEPAPTRYECSGRRRDGSSFPAEVSAVRISYAGQPASLAVIQDLSERKRLRLFESILPVCCLCGQVRDDTGTERGRGPWRSLQEYVREHSDTSLSHGFCPACFDRYCREQGLAPDDP